MFFQRLWWSGLSIGSILPKGVKTLRSSRTHSELRLCSHLGRMDTSPARDTDWRRLALGLGNVGQSLATTDVRHIVRLGEVFKDFLSRRWRRLIRRTSTLPAICSYSCDSTPLTTTETFRKKLLFEGGAFTVRRRGRNAGHFNIQRCWYKAGDHCGVIFTEAQRLKDQSSWTHFSSFLQLGASPRSAGHRGLLIEHHVEDRGLQ